MHGGLLRIVVGTSLACASGMACAMTAASDHRVQCNVTGGAKLRSVSGGASALCRAIEAAIGREAPGKSFSVDVRVLGPSRMSASVSTDKGRKVAEQSVSSMDRDLTSGSFERFARALAAEIARSGPKES